MRRFFKLSAAVALPLLLFLILTIIRPLFIRDAPVSETLFGLSVFIDPGHGGYDPGSERDQVLEKDLNLRIGLSLFEQLSSDGVLALSARTGDYDLSSLYSSNHKMEDLRRRAQLINDSGAALLVSIHLNTHRDTSVRGPMVYYRHQDESSKRLAESIQSELNLLTGLDKIIHAENYYLFRATRLPAVLVECGFLSNPNERRSLLSESYQRELAGAIYEGIRRYWQEL